MLEMLSISDKQFDVLGIKRKVDLVVDLTLSTNRLLVLLNICYATIKLHLAYLSGFYLFLIIAFFLIELVWKNSFYEN